MFFSRKPSESQYVKRKILNALIAIESVLIVAFTVLAAKVRHVGLEDTVRAELGVFLLLVAFPMIWLCCLSIFGAWDITILDNHIDGYRRLMRSSFMTFLIFSSASFLFKIHISRFVIFVSLVGGTIVHLGLRRFFLKNIEKRDKKANKEKRWLVLNKNGEANPKAYQFSQEFKINLSYFKSYENSQDFNIWTDEVTAMLNSRMYTKVLLTSVDEFTDNQFEYLTWIVQESGTEFIVYDNLGVVLSQNQIKRYANNNWIGILTPRISDSLRVVKRLFDLSLVIPAIIFLLPVLLIIAVCLKIDSRGSLLYTEKRIGQDGKLFTFPKFRTMKPGSNLIRLEVLGRPDEDMTERYRNDPRITRFGRFLRRYSLDELPQLWCVFIGSMSLVGPRPILPEEMDQLDNFHFKRQIAKPGLTGIWQISGRKDTTWEERMAFDIKYVQEWSVALDLILIARTFKAVVSGNGAY